MPSVRPRQAAFTFAAADPAPTLEELQRMQRIIDGECLRLTLARARGEIDEAVLQALLGMHARAWTACENELARVEAGRAA